MPYAALAAASATLLGIGAWRIAAAVRDPIGAIPTEGFELARARAAYETSRTCGPCHPDHVRSWKRTFHSTMTREARPKTILAPFDGKTFDVLDVRVTPWRSDDAYFLDFPEPGSDRPVTHRIVRVTGSRRMQQFETFENDRYVRLPVAWSIEQRRWLHLSEAFFHADGEDFDAYRAVWDLNCIFCHTTRPVPGLDARERLASHPAELGIACEACHGPGEEHARRMRSPLRRYAVRRSHPIDPTIVNPGRLDQTRSVQVCGHCHGQRLPADRERIREILERGDPFTPGEDLSRYFAPITNETMLGAYSFAPRFWGDGSPRLTAYEYQGLLGSSCYRRGTMTCLSCHAMHSGDPHGQLRPDRPGDAMCTQCHEQYAGPGRAAHTHHGDESEGSRCVACHMPAVVYGIMTWHPTHRIVSPDPASAAASNTPDACTLCHTGRSLQWAAASVERLWPRKLELQSPPLDATRGSAPEMVRALFAGDSVYRALAASRLGEWSPEVGIAKPAVPLLAQLLVDDHPAVRRAALDALARLTGGSDLPRADDPLASRDAARRRIEASSRLSEPMAGWPFIADGTLDRPRLLEWEHERKESDVSIGE